MNKDELLIRMICFSEGGMSSRDVVKKMKSLGISVSQSTLVKVISNLKRKKKLQAKFKGQKDPT